MRRAAPPVRRDTMHCVSTTHGTPQLADPQGHAREEKLLIFGMHSQPTEGPLSFNATYQSKDKDGKLMILVESEEKGGGDLSHSYSWGKGLFGVSPSGDIYFTIPDLAEYGIEQSNTKTNQSSALGQVYLGKINCYLEKAGMR